jgi:uncharacterized membrane protein
VFEPLFPAVFLLAAVGCALVAGIFFAFSSFIMSALARIPASAGIAAMQAINITVLNPLFFSVFFGTGVLSLVTLVAAVRRWGEPGAAMVGGASLLYLGGCLLVTMLFNVPRNEALATVDHQDPAEEGEWTSYVLTWTRWNHVRTACSLAAAVLFGMALSKGVFG